MPQSTLKAYRLPQDIIDALTTYKTDNNITETQAIIELIRNGILVWLKEQYIDE